jgi:hypothetical protein
MTNKVTFELVCQGLTNATMRIKEAEVSGTCASTDIFKEKLAQMEEILLTNFKPAPLASRNEYINEVTKDFEARKPSNTPTPYITKRSRRKGRAQKISKTDTLTQSRSHHRHQGQEPTNQTVVQLVQETGACIRAMLDQGPKPQNTEPSGKQRGQR